MLNSSKITYHAAVSLGILVRKQWDLMSAIVLSKETRLTFSIAPKLLKLLVYLSQDRT